MCGRATLSVSGEDLREAFDLEETPSFPPRFNIAPTQPIAVIRTPRRLEWLRWGLVPPWARDVREGNRFINARVETAPTLPAYRDAFAGRRCIVVVDGFYEWSGSGPGRRPFHIRRPDKKPFALAGLWSRWVSRDGEVVDSCTVLTTDAKGVVAPLHDRMPIVLEPGSYGVWLDPTTPKETYLAESFTHSAPELVAVAVSTRANNPANDDPSCLDPWVGPGELFAGS